MTTVIRAASGSGGGARRRAALTCFDLKRTKAGNVSTRDIYISRVVGRGGASIDALFGVRRRRPRVKRRQAASHERRPSRQVKWIKDSDDRSTLLCIIGPQPLAMAA